MIAEANFPWTDFGHRHAERHGQLQPPESFEDGDVIGDSCSEISIPDRFLQGSARSDVKFLHSGVVRLPEFSASEEQTGCNVTECRAHGDDSLHSDIDY